MEIPCGVRGGAEVRGPLGFARGRLFDCVGLRFANANFAQDDRGVEGAARERVEPKPEA